MIYCSNDAFALPAKYGVVVTESQYHAFLTEHGLEPGPWLAGGKAATHWFEGDSCDCVIVVCCPPYPDEPSIRVEGLIVHECVHVKQIIMQQMNEASPSREFEAYLTQQIYLNIKDAYNHACSNIATDRIIDQE